MVEGQYWLLLNFKKREKIVLKYLLCISALFLVACSDRNLDSELADLINFHQIESNPITDPKQQFASINSKEAQLGKLLFFTKSLSGNGDVACASCHHPFLGGDDDLSLSIGVDPVLPGNLGGKRVNKNGLVLVPRNAPTTFNSSLWKKHLFHDGRVERVNDFDILPAEISTPDEKFGDVDPRATSLLQAQAGFPVTSEHEMRSSYQSESSNEKIRDSLVKKLVESVESYQSENNNFVTWDVLFKQIYQNPVDDLSVLMSFDRVQHLLGIYQSTQIFVNNRWKDYLDGDHASLSDAEKRGAILFYSNSGSRGAGCISCHSGSFFTDEKFHVMAFPQIGEGKDGNGDDTGRYLRTGIPDDRYAFRTPSLLNVTHTAPYGHSGSFDTMEEVIKHHVNPKESLTHYDYGLSTLNQQGIKNERSKEFSFKALEKLDKDIINHSSILPSVSISSIGISDIVAFLNTLTDPCIEKIECLQSWVPVESENMEPLNLLHISVK
jgi:cytochrome c peroxidase